MSDKDQLQEEQTLKIEALTAGVLALQEENDKLKAEIDQLRAALETPATSIKMEKPKAKMTAADLPTFKVGNKTYRFRVHAFKTSEGKILAADVAKDKALAALVLEKYPGLVQLV